MKKFISIIICAFVMFGTAGCGEKESSPVTETSDRIIEELKNTPSFEDVDIELEAEKPEITDKANIIIYKAKKSGTELSIAITEDGKLMGVQVKGNINDETLECPALVSAVSNLSEFNVEQDIYNKLGEVIKEQKEKEEIGNLIAGITVQDTTVKYFIFLKEYAEE